MAGAKAYRLFSAIVEKLATNNSIYQRPDGGLFQIASSAVSETPKYIESDKLEVPAEGKFIVADLSLKTIKLFNNGTEFANLPIGTTGRPGAAWETPRGMYKIELKERNHFSSIGQVYMPFSMQFNGNYFIHGWTYYPDGTPVSAEFSGGCIKLKTADAEKIYNFAEVGTSVFVYSSEMTKLQNISSDKRYLRSESIIDPEVSAESYLAADVGSGEILLEKDRNLSLPAGRVSQLVSALVTLDAINFFNQATVTLPKNKTLSAATLLLPGEKVVVKDLLYPMLFGDQGNAATTLSSIMGERPFIAKMNLRANSIGLSETSFTSADGLALTNLSSATDLFKLARHILNFKDYLWQITRESEKQSPRHLWTNQNGMIEIPGFVGGVRGENSSGKESAVALVRFAFAGDERIISLAVMNSDNSAKDIKALASSVKNEFTIGGNSVTESLPEVLVPEATSTETSLVFVGDIMLDRGVEQNILRYGGKDYNFPFADLSKIQRADILFGNLEGPVSDQGRDIGNLYSFRMSPEAVPALAKQGFDVLSVANNHAGDWTRPAFADTFLKFQNSGISLTGGGLSKNEATEPKIIVRNGVKFGYLGFSDVGPNGLRAGSTEAGILIAADPDTSNIIKQASEKCDVLVVSFHFGNEYESKSNWRQRELAHMAIDNGARIVVGHHPHVPQETESYRGGVIMYSLGNFIFDQIFSTETMSGLAVKITFDGKNVSNVEEFKTRIDEMFRVSVQ